MTTTPRPGWSFLFDVDNTLLDNDRVKADFVAGIAGAVGSEAGDRFWEIYEEVRRAAGLRRLPGDDPAFSRGVSGRAWRFSGRGAGSGIPV